MNLGLGLGLLREPPAIRAAGFACLKHRERAQAANPEECDNIDRELSSLSRSRAPAIPCFTVHSPWTRSSRHERLTNRKHTSISVHALIL